MYIQLLYGEVLNVLFELFTPIVIIDCFTSQLEVSFHSYLEQHCIQLLLYFNNLFTAYCGRVLAITIYSGSFSFSRDNNIFVFLSK